ncbi:glycosyltransferase family 4 protein [Anaerofilum sp. BX8]|uniref:Glycosyltransferase family 4 protein n=1 Tax=Anaerofilum hominis TaxID=2763016 RepID=A0A923IEL2_9FIRM|nr:glycosyltransferase family 4 protein [Anaerofilum hominis]MBC5581177.1 glycosyltransferase family 4 protein [Anaerofilum hominis]
MRILVICQHYWPEPYPLADICEELAQRGHFVHLVTDVPNYPMGEIYPGYRKGRRREEEHNGVKITRTFTIARRRSALFRLLNYYSYAISSSLYAGSLKQDYDVVFANQTSPVMMSSAAFAYARKHQKKVVLYCMDLWPACLAAGGISEHSPVYRFFDWESKRLYRKPDSILITSRMFRGYLVQRHGVEDARITYLPQYAAAQFETEQEPPLPKDTVDLMFAGNIGAAQSLATVIRAAEILKEQPQLRWHIVGDGSELENLKRLAAEKGLTSVLFHGRRPPEEMPQYYAMADAMLVTLTADPAISLTLPGKMQTYMAAAKPIIGAADGEIPKVIEAAGCGFCAGAEDAPGLANAVQRYLECKNKRQLGQNARSYYETHFTRRHFMDTLEKTLKRYAAAENAVEEKANVGI